MRHLWVQLSIAFGAVVLLSVSLLLVISLAYADLERESLRADILASVEENLFYAEDGLVSQLEAHFSAGGTPQGAAGLIDSIIRRQPPQPFRVDLQYLAPDGQVLYGRLRPDATPTDYTLSQGTLRYAISLQGDLQPAPENSAAAPLNAGPAPRLQILGSLRPENLLLLTAITGTILGVLAGVLMSRRLAAPLSQLALTARQVGARDFSLRVQPTGTTETRDLAQAFNEMAAMLQDSERQRSNLVADVAHELRTPLTVMEGSLRALIDDVYPLTKAEVLTLYDQTRHLSRMVNDLHELSLADAQELPFERVPVDLGDLLDSIADIFRPIAEAESIAFALTLPEDGHLSVTGDRARLSQVIQNLLVNALRHTPNGGRISLHAARHAGSIQIDIADTGEGIPADDLAHVFERFYRADRSRDRASGGAGLGLAIGKAIIEAHGGQISVSSRTTAPSGTCFRILLPQAVG